MKSKIKIGIVGSTGYTGVVLTRLLLDHPHAELTYLTSERFENKNYFDVFPAFFEEIKIKCKKTDPSKIAKSCDVVFLATPHGFANSFAPKLIKHNKDLILIDLSADFRLRGKVSNKKITYGLPELYREKIKKASFIANPGCYPTSIILALAPALKSGLIDTNTIIADSKSGTSGAGRGTSQGLHFTELNQSFSPYKLAGAHRHIPEIENEISKLSKKKSKIVFSPHLLPINRGIVSTVYGNLKKKNLTQGSLTKLYKDFYKNEGFVKVLPSNIYPSTNNVRYSNYCHVTPLIDKRTNKLILVSAIDNMVKGASGQAIQNMNLIFGFDENEGLKSLPHLP